MPAALQEVKVRIKMNLSHHIIERFTDLFNSCNINVPTTLPETLVASDENPDRGTS